MRAWIDGALLADPDAAALRLSDHGFTVGDGVFEAIKVVAGEPFALERHLERLVRGAAGLGLVAVDLDVVRRGVDAVLDAEHLPLGRIRVTVTSGPSPMGPGRGPHPTVVVVAAPMAPPAETTSVVTVPWPRNERGATVGIKTTSYVENVVALAEAARQGASEAVFANLAGHLCEAATSNVFYVVDGELRTPTLVSGCLPGVTRALLLEWYGAREVDEPIEVAEAADEVFLASTTRDVQPVTRWGERDLVPGPVTADAAAAWKRREPELIGR